VVRETLFTGKAAEGACPSAGSAKAPKIPVIVRTADAIFTLLPLRLNGESRRRASFFHKGG
jgi:hypothetical protein